MDKIQKFLHKLPRKDRNMLAKIFKDILFLDLKIYDVKPLQGVKGVYRLRKGDIRVIFLKEQNRGVVLDIAYRKDIYKK